MNEEIRLLSDEIQDFEKEYYHQKFDYEQSKAEMQLYTDFAELLGKAKPTVAEKEAYIEMEIGDKKLAYRMLRAELEAKKRLFQVMLREIGDSE